MAFSLFSLLVLTLGLPSSRGQRQGTIGPVGDLVVSNGLVSPDGFERLAALANSRIDGSLITGNKVGLSVIRPQQHIRTFCIGRCIQDQCRQPAQQRHNSAEHVYCTTVLFYTISASHALLQHWHGLFQKGTGWADGPPGVNQASRVITPTNHCY